MISRLVGILNLTPDSFSDGGAFADSEEVAAWIDGCIECGVGIIDIGAQSTRPGAEALSARDEWQRLEPILRQILPRYRPSQAIFSIDTYHAEVARRALDHGVRWVNDVSGFSDPAMVNAVRDRDCMLVAMHSLTIPADPQVNVPQEEDIIEHLIQFAHARLQMFERQGIARERIIFDPGIGFNKTATQSLEIIRRITELRDMGMPLMVGHSRKSFLKAFTAAPAEGRDHLTLALSTLLAQAEVEYIRVHNVRAHAEVFRMLEAL